MRILLHWVILTLAIMASAYVVPGIHVAGILTAIIAAAILAFINLIIKPVVKILTLPINIITLGLFSFVLNGLFFWFVSRVIAGFTIDTFKAALIGALIVSVINWIGNRVLGHND